MVEKIPEVPLQNFAQPVNTAELFEKTPKVLSKVLSEMDKIDEIEMQMDGRVTHKILRKSNNDSAAEPRDWKDLETFKKWRASHVQKRQRWLKQKLTPL